MAKKSKKTEEKRSRGGVLRYLIILVLLGGLGASYWFLRDSGEAPPEKVADTLGQALVRLKNQAVWVAPEGPGDLPAAGRSLPSWDTVVGLSKALDGADEERVAEILKQAGIKALLVDRGFPFRARRADAVLNRMTRLRFCERFNATLMADGWALYELRDKPSYSLAEKKALIDLARAGLNEPGKMPEDWVTPAGLKKREGQETEVLLTVWRGPRYRTLGRSRHRSPVRAVLKAAERAARKWHGRARAKGWPPLAEALPSSIRLQLDIGYDRGAFVDRTDRTLFYGYELGLAGLYLNRGNKTKVLPPHYPVWFGKEYYSKVLSDGRKLGSLFKITCGSRPGEQAPAERRDEHAACMKQWHYKNQDVNFGRFAAISFREREPEGQLMDLYRGVPLVPTGSLNRERALVAVEQCADNLARSIFPDGKLWPHGHRHEQKIGPEPGKSVYRYAPVSDYYSKDYNMVRHVLVPFVLARSQRFLDKPLYLERAKQSLGFLLAHSKWEDDRAFPYFKENVKMGAASVAALALVEVSSREKLSPELDKLTRGIGEFMLWMQDDNGHYKQYHVPPGHPYFGRETSIFPGEILLGVSRMYDYTKDERYRKSFEKGAEFYHKWFKDKEAKKRGDGTYGEGDRIDILQFTPWYIMAVADFYYQTKDEKYARWGIEVGHWAVDTHQVLPPRAIYPDHVGAFWQREREQPAMHGCVYTEGAAAALGLAKAIGDARAAAKFRNATLWGCRFALQLQYIPGDSDYFIKRKARSDGAFRYSVTDDHIRIDYAYHAMSSLTQALMYLDDDEWTIVTPEPDMHLPAAFPEN